MMRNVSKTVSRVYAVFVKIPHSDFLSVCCQKFPYLINWVSVTELGLTPLLTLPSTHLPKSSEAK